MARGKGSGFERELAKTLSLWISSGKTDDIFWRSSASGGRATQRAKVGKQTRGHGDLVAGLTGDADLDETVSKFSRLVTIEAKRGYSTANPYTIMDRREDAAIQMWESFFSQADREATQAGTYGWLIIAMRNRSERVVWMARKVANLLKAVDSGFVDRAYPKMSFSGSVRRKTGKQPVQTVKIHATCVTLDYFLSVPPTVWTEAFDVIHWS